MSGFARSRVAREITFMKTLIIANWKLNPTNKKEALELFKLVKNGAGQADNATVVICPPFVYLPLLSGMTLGAQNVAFEDKGAFTGEVSPVMLKDLGIEYVLIGHSERRKYFAETNEMVNQKIKASLRAGLSVVLCIGENEGENALEVLALQLAEGLQTITKEEMEHVAIAYEPVWAIGTGKNCGIEQTAGVAVQIRAMIEKLYDKETAEKTAVLYGGSVKSENSGEYLEKGGVNGLLVGGASLKADEFIKIIASAK